MVDEVKRPARRIALLALTAAVAIVTVATILLMKNGNSSAPQASARRDAAMQPAVATPDAGQATVAVDAAAAPGTAKVAIDTVPSGAIVTFKGTTYKTPFELEFPAGAGRVELTATLNGFLPGKLVIAPGETSKKLVLKKRPHTTSQPTDDVERPPF
jgi:hypothetical protein